MSYKGSRLAHLATDLGAKEQVCKRNELREAAHKAVLSYLLSNSTVSVARYEVSDDTDSAVVEATEQTVLELVRHICCLMMFLNVVCPRIVSLNLSTIFNTPTLTSAIYTNQQQCSHHGAYSNVKFPHAVACATHIQLSDDLRKINVRNPS